MLDKARNLPIQSQADNPFMPGFDSDDYAPPEFRLVQPTSKAHTEGEIALGLFHCEATGEATETLNFSILHVQRTLTLWGQDLAFPECSSDNRITPRPGGSYPGPCGVCPARNKGCYPGYNILCARIETLGDPEPEVFLLRVTGTSVFPWRKCWPKIKTRYNNLPWKAQISLTAERRSNDKGTFYVMAPGEPEPLEKQVAETVRDLALGMAGLDIGAVDAQAQQAHIEAPAGQAARARLPASRVRATMTLERAQSIVELSESLGVPPETITTFINDTFKKDKLSQLQLDEAATLEDWLHQEFGQLDKPAPDPFKDLPF